NAAMPATLQLGGNGATAYAVAFPGNGTAVLRRFWVDGGKAVSLEKDTVIVPLPSPPAGTPAVGTDSVLVPLGAGSLCRAWLPGAEGAGKGQIGPDWRTGTTTPDAKPFVVWINEVEFLTTDGNRGITHWSWPRGKECVALKDEQSASTAEMRSRIV